MKRSSLLGRITLLLGAATLLVLGASALMMDKMVDVQVLKHFDTSMLSEARALTALTQQRTIGSSADPAATAITDRPIAWMIRCDNGYRQHSRSAPIAYPRGWPQNSSEVPNFKDVAMEEKVFRVLWYDFYSTAQNTRCHMLLNHSREEIDRTLRNIDIILLVIPFLGLLLVVWLARALVRRGLRPLALLGNQMLHIGPARPGTRLPDTGIAELEPLVQKFNAVLQRMDQGIRRERDFAAALAHETRTRLAELRTLVEVEQRYPSERPANELLAEIHAISRDLHSTVAGLLLLTRLEAGLETLKKSRVDPWSMAHEHMVRLADRCLQRRLQIHWHADPTPSPLWGDAALLDLILRNVLENACTYATAGSRIDIGLSGARLTVTNLAPTLSRADVGLLGQRFWRKDSGGTGHAGLGLALAAAAARAMDVDLGFSIGSDKRLCVQLDWRGTPRAASSELI